MEREKQKKMERERMVQEKYIMDQIKSEHVEPEPAPMPVYVEVRSFRIDYLSIICLYIGIV